MDNLSAVAAAAPRWAVVIVRPPGYVHSGAFQEVGETLVHALRRLGRDAVLTDELAPAGRRAIVLGSNLLPAMGRAPAPDAVLYNLEQIQPGSSWLTPQLLELFRRYEVWDYSPRNAARLVELGLARPRVVPIGTVPELERIAPAAEDVDVLFYGSMNARRQRIVEALRARGLRVEARFGVYGEERDRLIARARVILNVHYYEAKVFEIVRVSYLLANGRCVVSERGADPDEERGLEGGVAFAPYEGLVDACAALVRDPEARRRLGEEGRRLMRARDAVSYLREALGGPPAAEAPPPPSPPGVAPMQPSPEVPPLSVEDVTAMAAPAGKRILAVGCGDGQLGAALLAAGAAEVVGLDGCARGLTRSRLTAVFQIDPDAAPELPYPDGYFEVLLVEDLSRLLVPVPTLQHLRRWLADAGRLVCVVPNATHEASLASLLTLGCLPAAAGARPTTPAAALEALRAGGFQVEDEVILVRTEPSPAAAGIGAAMAALGVDPEQAADQLTLARAIVAGRPAAVGAEPRSPLPDPWRDSRQVKVLVAPDLADPEDRWLPTVAELVRGLSGNEAVTVGIALPLPFLSAPPQPLQEIAQAGKVDLVCIEAPVDRPGWERLLAGASVWVPSSEHALVADAARRVGTQIQRAA